MGWELSRWIAAVRVLQLLCSFVSGSLNGWLLYYIYTNSLGLTRSIVFLEILVAIIFIYTSLSLLVIHGHQRSKRTVCRWMAGGICFDVLVCFVVVAIISILASAGVPSNCSGLTKPKPLTRGDDEDQDFWAKGFNTGGFSNEQNSNRGALDRYCDMERGFYVVVIGILLGYIINIILSVFGLCMLTMHSQDDVEKLLREHEAMVRLEQKIQDQETSSVSTPTHDMTPVSPELSGNLEAACARENTQHSSMPRTTITHHLTPSSSSTRPTPPHLLGYAETMLDTLSSSSSYCTPHPAGPVPPVSPISTTTTSHGRGFILSQTEVSANLAMVTDGSRYNPQAGHNQLPPYSPGNTRSMHGHGHEGNDMRLSEYVKGSTAAQDMKDSNGF